MKPVGKINIPLRYFRNECKKMGLESKYIGHTLFGALVSRQTGQYWKETSKAQLIIDKILKNWRFKHDTKEE